jgi:hypothetical protein
VLRRAFGLYAGWAYELVVNGFFAALGVGGFVVVLLSALGHPVAGEEQIPGVVLLIAGPFAALTLTGLLRVLAALFLPAYRVEGRIDQAGELIRDSSRVALHMWHVVIGGHDYSFHVSALVEHARTNLLAAGRQARLRVARDGQVLRLEVDRRQHVTATHELPTPSAPAPLSASERARILRWAMRELGLALGLSVFAAAFLLVSSGMAKLAFGLLLVPGLVWMVAALRVRLTLGRLPVGAPTRLIEGRQKLVVGVLNRRSVGGVPVEDASEKPPSPFAQQVRGRAVTLETPGLASSRTTVVVEWVAEA